LLTCQNVLRFDFGPLINNLHRDLECSCRDSVPVITFSLLLDERDFDLRLNSTLTNAPQDGSELGWGGCAVGQANVVSPEPGRGGICSITR
jgi:hypothetical protein